MSFMLLSSAFAVAAHSPKSLAEKKKIAQEMEIIAKQLDVRCEYCHADAERGIKQGDFTLLTEEGEYAHEAMFPLSKDFRVECQFCHTGATQFNAAGERALADMKFMRRYQKTSGKKLTCKSCHIPGPPGEEFRRLTAFGRSGQ